MDINTIEYADDNKWFLTIGKNAPWDNFHIRIPRIVAAWINNSKNKEQLCLEKMDKMCSGSLDPETYNKWEDVKARLIMNRKNLSGLKSQ